VLVALQDHIAKANGDGKRVRHLVLTDGRGDMDLPGFYNSWSEKLRPRMKRAGVLGDYACAMEVQPKSGRLHAHVLLVDNDQGGGFVDKPWLDKAASGSGLGHCWIESVDNICEARELLAAYLTKGGAGGDFSVPTKAVGEIGSYMAKAHEMERLAGFASKKLRPFRVSGQWNPKLGAAGKILRAELYGVTEDPGPWKIVNERSFSKFLDPMRERQKLEADRAAKWAAATRFHELEQLADEALQAAA